MRLVCSICRFVSSFWLSFVIFISQAAYPPLSFVFLVCCRRCRSKSSSAGLVPAVVSFLQEHEHASVEEICCAAFPSLAATDLGTKLQPSTGRLWLVVPTSARVT